MRHPAKERRGPALHPRREQLRLAKRAQRERDRLAGMQNVALKLPASEAERLRAAIAQPGFTRRLEQFLDDELVDIDQYECLKALCWNRRSRYVAAEDALRLYERNWRLVDKRRMKAAERELIDRLVTRFGAGVLNV
jgi:hypothetical protein